MTVEPTPEHVGNEFIPDRHHPWFPWYCPKPTVRILFYTDHPQVNTVGDLGRAIPLHKATLADRERVLGPDHPDTLISRNNLANAYQAVGDLGRGIPLYEATLADGSESLLTFCHLHGRGFR